MTKLYIYKGRIALFDFQKISLVIMHFTNKKTNTNLLLSKFGQLQAHLDAFHNR